MPQPHPPFAEKEQQLISDLLLLPGPQERLAALMERTHRHHLPQACKSPERRIPGCVSGVWVEISPQPDGTHLFTCDADSPLVKGLAAALCDLFSHCPTAEILSATVTLWQATQLQQTLSPTRLAGLAALRQRLAHLAAAAASPPSVISSAPQE
ncbi:MAG: SufE family protein [Verrucomicrobiales bacterium]|nr:SufE family protein [Verrucomicrobiales bacterium]